MASCDDAICRSLLQISEQLGLLHVSKGEGCDRHIEVFKTVSKQPSDMDKTNSVTGDNLSSDVSTTDVCLTGNINDSSTLSTQVKSSITDVEAREISHVGDRIDDSQQFSESAVSSTDVSENVDSNNLTETADSLSETSSAEPTLRCLNCGRQIPEMNYQLHSLHCKSSVVKSTSKKSKEKSSNKVTSLFFSVCNNIWYKYI